MEGREARETLRTNPDHPDSRRLQRLGRAGDRARDQFIEANLRLVVSTVKRQFKGSSLPLEDLVQIGNLGLMHAVEKFDYRRGFRFSTYAVSWICQYVGRASYQQSHSSKLTWNGLMKIKAVVRARQELTTELGHEPTVYEIAGRLDWHWKDVDVVIRWDRDAVSLDAPVEDFRTTMADFVADLDTDPFDTALGAAAREEMQRAMKVLTDKERGLI